MKERHLTRIQDGCTFSLWNLSWIAFVVILLLLTMAIPARADSIYQASWDTTAGWDGGVKATIDTATDSCLASGQGFQLNATGGNYGVSQRCPAGVSQRTPNVAVSYDGSSKFTTGNAAHLKDFGTWQESLTFWNGVRNVSDSPNGGAIWIGTGSMRSGIPSSLAQKLPMQVTFFFTLKTNNSGSCGGICTLFDQGLQGGAGFLWFYYFPGSGNIELQYSNGVISVLDYTGSPLTVGGWNRMALRMNFTTGVTQLWTNGAFSSTQTMSGTPVQVAATTAFWGSYQGSSSPFGGSLDDFGIIDGWASNVVMGDLTKGQGTYRASGFWSSPNINLTDQRPEAIALGFRNQTEFSYVQSLYIFNASDDSELWHTLDISFATGDSNVTYVVLPAGGSWPRGNVSIYLTIGLTGAGNGTAQVIYAAMIFASLPALVTVPSDLVTWITVLLFVVVIAVLLLLSWLLDNSLPLLIAGVVTLLLSLQVWALVASLPITLAVLALGLLLMAFAIQSMIQANTQRV